MSESKGEDERVSGRVDNLITELLGIRNELMVSEAALPRNDGAPDALAQIYDMLKRCSEREPPEVRATELTWLGQMVYSAQMAGRGGMKVSKWMGYNAPSFLPAPTSNEGELLDEALKELRYLEHHEGLGTDKCPNKHTHRSSQHLKRAITLIERSRAPEEPEQEKEEK